jgi:hypothetical protein
LKIAFMRVRIRFAKSPTSSERRRRNQRAALAFATLLQPAAVTSLALAFWSLAAGLQWVGSFAIPSGIFSHWETWMAGAGAIWLCASALNRYGKSGGQAAV